MSNSKAQKSIAVLVPARNEAALLSQTLSSALTAVSRSDLYVVDDGSSDSTCKIAKRFTKNVLRLKSNKGKARALTYAISRFKLPQKYQFIFPVDADTKINPDFLRKSLRILQTDREEKYICVTGKVTGASHNWLTSYRVWEYTVGQLVHKAAQDKEQAIAVCPGCATIYRSKLFAKIQIPSDTVVEDMDLTFLIHRKNLGKIAYTTKVSVITQDPYTLKDYVRQISRWYKGYFQCLKKYRVPWGRQTLDLELGLQTIEGLAGGLLALFLILGLPFIITKQPLFLAAPLSLDFLLFFAPTVFLTVFVHSDLKILKYLPIFYLIRLLNSLVFLYSFFESIFTFNTTSWNQSSRYFTKGGKICTAP